MCRAVYALVVGSTEEVALRLRRAVGLEVQVMDVLTDAGPLPEGPFDVIVVDAATPGAREAVAGWRQRSDAAVVWVGEDPPSGVHHAVAWGDDLPDTLPGAVTKALLARRS